MRELSGQPKQDLGETFSSGNSQQIREEKEMTTLNQNIQTGPMNMGQISGINSKNERGIEMLKTEKQNWFSRNLGNIVPVKLLVGLAVGAMLMTAIGMPGSGVSADEPSRPLVLAYQGFGSLADVVTYAKVERQGFGSIDDWANSGKVTHQGFGSLATIPTTNAKVERQGLGSIDDWANVTHRGFGSLDDIGAVRR